MKPRGVWLAALVWASGGRSTPGGDGDVAGAGQQEPAGQREVGGELQQQQQQQRLTAGQVEVAGLLVQGEPRQVHGAAAHQRGPASGGSLKLPVGYDICGQASQFHFYLLC